MGIARSGIGREGISVLVMIESKIVVLVYAVKQCRRGRTHGTTGHRAPRTPFGLTAFYVYDSTSTRRENGQLVQLFPIRQARLSLELNPTRSCHYYIVSASDTNSAPSPPALTKPMNASDFRLPAL